MNRIRVAAVSFLNARPITYGLERHLGAKPDCPADTGLRDSRAGGRYLLRSGRLSPVAEDRPHFYVRTLGAAYADAPASWPAWPDRVSVFRLTLARWARALHARQAGSRLPLTAKDGRSQISGDLWVQRKAWGTSAAAFLPDAPGRIGVPSP